MKMYHYFIQLFIGETVYYAHFDKTTTQPFTFTTHEREATLFSSEEIEYLVRVYFAKNSEGKIDPYVQTFIDKYRRQNEGARVEIHHVILEPHAVLNYYS